MRCPECKNNETSVSETRTVGDGTGIKRRRKCMECGAKFVTLEMLERVGLMVKKRDGRLEPFDREKILKGVNLACRKRMIEEKTMIDLVKNTEKIVLSKGSKIVMSQEIGEIVMSLLKKLDKVSYLRFASVCCYFDGVDHFESELENLRS